LYALLKPTDSCFNAFVGAIESIDAATVAA
jgi:hypothetical protein